MSATVQRASRRRSSRSRWRRRPACPQTGRTQRRCTIASGSAAAAAWSASPLAAATAAEDPQLQEAIAKLEYLTPPNRVYILDKGKAGVAKLPAERLREIGRAHV